VEIEASANADHSGTPKRRWPRTRREDVEEERERDEERDEELDEEQEQEQEQESEPGVERWFE
jgi:hypothetical protein